MGNDAQLLNQLDFYKAKLQQVLYLSVLSVGQSFYYNKVGSLIDNSTAFTRINEILYEKGHIWHMCGEKRCMHNEVKSIIPAVNNYWIKYSHQGSVCCKPLPPFFLIYVCSSVFVEITQQMQVWTKLYSFLAPTSKILSILSRFILV